VTVSEGYAFMHFWNLERSLIVILFGNWWWWMYVAMWATRYLAMRSTEDHDNHSQPNKLLSSSSNNNTRTWSQKTVL